VTCQPLVDERIVGRQQLMHGPRPR
jgi:hypothetical protein